MVAEERLLNTLMELLTMPNEDDFEWSNTAPQPSESDFEWSSKPSSIAWSDVPGKAVKNLLPSAGNLIKGLATAAAHPIDTALGGLDMAIGGIYNVLPKKVTDFVDKTANPQALKRAINAADSIGQDYKESYGSEESFKRKLSTDPVGVLGDVSMILGGAGSATKIDRLSRLAKLIDPLTPVLKGAELAADATKPIAKGSGALVDLVMGNRHKAKARAIATEATGDNLPVIMAANDVAPSSFTAGQAAYGVDQDAWQALGKLAQDSDKDSFYRKKADQLSADQLQELSTVAGGSTQSDAMSSRIGSKKTLNEITTPMREKELSSANVDGKLLPVAEKLKGEVSSLENMAENKVEDARRFNAAGDRADARANNTFTVDGMPRVPGRYTYMNELRSRAEDVVGKSASDSLAYGEAARFKKYQLDSLEASGLKPLTSEPIISSIKDSLKNPSIGVDDLNRSVLNNVAQKLEQWTDKGTGVIDASALYEIRKSAVNSEIDRLLPNADAKTKAVRAASILSQVKPLIDSAIEKAGGTGWRNYLKTYEEGMHQINQQKLASKAIDMFKNSPDSFIKLVNGDDIKAIEKVFGAGSYDIVKEMGDKLDPLRKVSSELQRDKTIANQASQGSTALGRILDDNSSKLKIPFMGAKGAAANEIINHLQGKVSSKTLDAIVEGMKSGKSANEMLAFIPAVDRYAALKYLNSNHGNLKKLFRNDALRALLRNGEVLDDAQKNEEQP